MVAIDLSKRQALDANPKAIQQINYTGNLYETNNRAIYFIIEEAKGTKLGFPDGIIKVWCIYFL